MSYLNSVLSQETRQAYLDFDVKKAEEQVKSLEAFKMQLESNTKSTVLTKLAMESLAVTLGIEMEGNLVDNIDRKIKQLIHSINIAKTM